MSRISLDEARELWLHADDEELKARAQAARARFHEPDRATYMARLLMRISCEAIATNALMFPSRSASSVARASR